METAYRIVVTAIIVKDNKYLITRRSPNKKRWPGKWTVPGGNLDPNDYQSTPKDTVDAWYNVLEKTVRREVKEEVGLDITNITYVTSIVADYGDPVPALIISLMAEHAGGDIKLQESETDKAEWVSAEEAKKYELIDGIYEEIVIADSKRNGLLHEWQRLSQ
jgi:8-oxo-dGTP pyrophosphatase MutT (NUDIX family)